MVTRYDPKIHHRRSIRLKGYDYAQQGAYFVTICAYNRECLFGNVVDGNMDLNALGRMVKTVWNELPDYYEGVGLDDFVIMPNHIHGIIVLTSVDMQFDPKSVGARFIAPSKSIAPSKPTVSPDSASVGAQFIAPSKSTVPSKSTALPNPASVGAQFIAPQARFIAPSKSIATPDPASVGARFIAPSKSIATPDPASVGAQFIAPQARFIAPSESTMPSDSASVGAQFIAPQARFIAPSKSTAPSNPAKGAINRARGVMNHAPTVGEIVRGFKARCTHAVNKIRQTPGTPVWQRNYYEHIIRNEADYNRIAEYVANNPQRWMEDSLHPDNPMVEMAGRSPSRNTSTPGNRDE